MAEPLKEVPLTDVKLTDSFWAPKLETNRRVTVWHNIKECESTGRIANFKRAGGSEKGEHRGLFFNDSDVYKVIEGASYILAAHPEDKKLDAKLDEWIGIIAKAQEPDGYLYTEYQLKSPGKKFANLKDMHELYCAGHLFEAAVAHHRATGKKSLLDVATKLADLIDNTWGPGKRNDPDGHEEVELALIKLSDETGEPRYRKLAEFFLNERGRSNNGRKLYGEYHQDHKPLEESDEVVGHAVRQMYYLCAATDVALHGDDRYVSAIDRLWDNMTTGKLYVTGGVGAKHAGEAFGAPFELPNESAYAETCAGIGNALWNDRLALLHGDAKYVDLFERALYNGFLSGVSLSGDKFFYTNPLASRGTHHRTPWFECACCPPNVLRFMASLPGRIYAVGLDEKEKRPTLYVNLYASNTAQVTLPGADHPVTIKQDTQYPWDGKVKLIVTAQPAQEFALRLRVPNWATGATVSVNGHPMPLNVDRGYAVVDGKWFNGDVVELNLFMPIKRVHADERVKDDAGRVAVQRGPVVYAAEAVDNGGAVTNLYLPPENELKAEHRAKLLGGVTVITGTAMVKSAAAADGKPAPLTLIPYYAWDNREAGEMAVWLAEDAALAKVPPPPTIASKAKASASRGVGQDNISAVNDRVEPASSNDQSLPRFTFWPYKGTTEWVQYDFNAAAKVGGVDVYFFDDVPPGGCKVPASWKVLYKDGNEWKPVKATGDYTTKKDAYNRVTFEPVTTPALRLEITSQKDFSAGLLEWRVDEAK